MNSILEALRNNGFATADYMVFVVYIIILVGMGLFLSRTKKGEEKSSTDYFLAGNTLTWWAVGASLIAANISAEQFIGMSGSAFASGIAQAAYELMAAATLLVVGKFLLPLMIEKKIFTIPQFLRERYNWGVGFAFSLLWLFLYVFVNLTSVSWLGALAIQQILGLPTDMTINFAGMEIDQVRMCIILALFIIAGVYSIYGGLASVAWTDVMQVTFLVGGGLITAYAALSVIGGEMGIGGAWDALMHIKDYLASIDGDKHFNLVVTRNEELYPVINGVVDAAGKVVQKEDPFFTNPGIVLIFGALWLTNLGYWGFNQYIIQKGLAAKSLSEAKKGMVFAAFLKILIPFIVCIPGVCAFYIMNAPELFAFVRRAVACQHPPQSVESCRHGGHRRRTGALVPQRLLSALSPQLHHGSPASCGLLLCSGSRFHVPRRSVATASYSFRPGSYCPGYVCCSWWQVDPTALGIASRQRSLFQ